MQYQFTERQEFIKTIEFANSNALLNIQRITYFKEEDITGSFTKKEFRYSFDNAVWTNWNTLTQGNLAGIQFRDNPNFWLQVKYSRNGIGSGNIQRWYLFYESNTPTPPVPPHTLIDADLLQGEPGLYYLDPTNQIGPYPNIKIENTSLDPSTISVYNGRSDTSLGTTFYLRTLKGEGIIQVSASDGEITIFADASIVGAGVDGRNIGSGDVSIFAGKSGLDLLFKTIKAGSGVTLSYPDPSTIQIDVSGGGSFSGDVSASHVFYDPLLDPSLSMPTSVGGIPAGTKVSDLAGDSVTSILNDLLFPTQFPILTGPTNGFTITPTTGLSNYQEIGAVININSAASFNRGSISPQYTAASSFRSGLPNNYDFAGFGLIDASSTLLSNNQTITGYTVIQGNQPSWSSRVMYSEGVQPYDSKGNIFNVPLSAGTTGFLNRTFEGVYPLFGTTSSITVLTKQTLVSMLSATNIVFNLVPETGGNKQKIEIPVAWRTLIGIQQFNTFTSAWEYPGGSASASLLLWTTSATTESIQGNIINYTQYTYNGTDRSSVQIRLVF